MARSPLPIPDTKERRVKETSGQASERKNRGTMARKEQRGGVCKKTTTTPITASS